MAIDSLRAFLGELPGAVGPVFGALLLFALQSTPRAMISVVIPVLNEQASVGRLCQKLREALPQAHEIVFVDDGSTDSTWQALGELHRAGHARAIRFARNFGKTAALKAGFAASRGEIIFTLDGDLQDDPSEIPRFLEMIDQGHDLVSGWKKIRQDPLTKVIASRIFNWAVRQATGVKLHDINCGFKAYRAEVARSIPLQGEWHRFTPVLAEALGYRVGELVVTHHPRRHGKSHYGFSRLPKGFLDLLTVLLVTRYAGRPSHGFGLAALAAFAPGVALLVAPWPLPLAGAALVSSAAVFLAAGWMAELLVERSTHDVPAYRVREQLD